MAQAIVAIDGALTTYARQHGGRFIRFGSTTEARMRQHSDVDIIADCPGEASLSAADFAEQTCFDNGMTPDAHAGAYLLPVSRPRQSGGGSSSHDGGPLGDIERDVADARRHFGRARQMFERPRGQGAPDEYYFQTGAFMHAMLAGYTAFEAGMKRLMALLGEPLPTGADWHSTLCGAWPSPFARCARR